MSEYNVEQLKQLPAEHGHLVGIDSDGCVFDSMTVKQSKCFHTLCIEKWGLQSIESLLRETMEFINLFSSKRGQDRFYCFLESVKLLQKRPEVIASGVPLPDIADLQNWWDGGGPYGNDGLKAAIAGERDAALKDSASLARILDWSLAVDACVKTLDVIPPFPHCKKFLERVGEQSDAIVVSSTPIAALTHEWETNDIRKHIRFIAAKEIGTKVDHLEAATGGKYDLGKVLMIGDAPKDMESAHTVGVSFYPINPGSEDASWQRLDEEIYAQFLEGTYTKEREAELIDIFMQSMPEDPPWDEV